MELETFIAVSCWGERVFLGNRRVSLHTNPVNRLLRWPPFRHVVAQQGGAAEGNRNVSHPGSEDEERRMERRREGGRKGADGQTGLIPGGKTS